MATNTMVIFDCSVCLERTEAPQKDIHRAFSDSDDQVCVDCAESVTSLFKEALETEYAYPPQSGGKQFELDLWSDLLGDEFVKKYQEKTIECETPVKHRIYCQHKASFAGGTTDGAQQQEVCNAFLADASKQGSKSDDTTDSDKEKTSENPECKQMTSRHVCSGLTCLKCRAPAGPVAKSGPHVCAGIQDERQSNVFDEKKRGDEWQQCPDESCGVKLALWDGCNHITCNFCGTEFCFLRGKEVEHNSNHWTAGNPCPRYGKSDTQNPIFGAALPDERPVLRNISLKLDDGSEIEVNAQRLSFDFPLLSNARQSFNAMADALELEIQIHEATEDWHPHAMAEVLAMFEGLARNIDHIMTDWAVNNAPEEQRQVVDPV